ncbi:PREDICTED: putative pectinesterase 52 [Populus euphratica]|uniref:Pectinesterase n=1 Tax=Populus euphratica TaxID=75702 RepID=A0AAJ6XMF0_POPEU|nr:PREDICTED: putative pectinesterase 52 [Populus euphratica]
MQKPLFNVIVILFITISSSNSQAIDCKPGRGKKVRKTVVVDQSGKGHFIKIQDAIDSIPINNDRWIKVRINPGTYIEQVTIPDDKPCIFLEGRDRTLTTITYNAHERTDTSATFTSSPSNIVAKGITFKNSYNLPFKQNINYGIKIPGVGVAPALSARIYGDKSAFYDCAFLGVQDTLWDVQGRHHFFNCYIEGAVDFIFGAGQSFYEGCSINVTSNGVITAQGREFPNDPSGFVFSGCTISGIKGVRAFLGRAYRPYSRVIFQDSYFSKVVDPLGWNAWGYAGQEENFTYVEVKCKGPGSNKSKRVPWVRKPSTGQHQLFSKPSFIDQDGWLAKLPL